MKPAVTRALISVGLLSVAAVACSKKKDADATSETAPSASASALAKPSASAIDNNRPGEEAQVCSTEPEKVWGTAINTRTGLTRTQFPDGRSALGYATGYRPRVLIVDKRGNVRVVKIAQAAGSKIGKGVPSGERRDLQRVTPLSVDGKTRAYADYRDKYKNGHRRISCGPAENDRDLLVFDGEPIYDPDAKKKAKDPAKKVAAKPAAPPSAKPTDTKGAPPKLTLKPNLKLKVGAIAPKVGSGLVSKPVAVKPPPAKRKTLREVRDCRSFVRHADEAAFAVGSELVGKPSGSDEHEWTMEFFIDRGKGAGRLTLQSVKLGKNPKKLHTFEAPVIQQLPSSDLIVATRYRGGLQAWLIDKDKRKKKGYRRFSGGYPSLPRFRGDGSDWRLILSQKVNKTDWKIATLLLNGNSPDLPAKLTRIEFEKDPGSKAEPTFVRLPKGQRWVLYQSGDRRKSQLYLQPVDGDLKASGKSYEVTAPGDNVYESTLLSLGDDRLMAAWIRQRAGKGAELVTQVLSCAAKS